MDISKLYALVAGSVSLLLVLYRILSQLRGFVQRWTLLFFLKHLIYPFLLRRSRFFEPISRYRFFMQASYFLLNVVLMVPGVPGVDNWAQAGTRAGILSVINLVPLMLAGQLSLVADLIGVTLRSYIRIHGTIGYVSFAQALTHVVIFLSTNSISVRDKLQFFGLLGGIAFATIILLLSIRKPFYEFFIKTHAGLAMLVAGALWRHVSAKKTFPRIYLLIGGGILLSTTVMQITIMLFRNLAYRKPRAKSFVSHKNNAAKVTIAIPRPFKVRAGQYIYLKIPGLSFWSIFQSHPFMITWWDENPDGKADSLSLLIKSKRGFTDRLLRYTAPNQGFYTWIDGPYGAPKDIGEYGSVLMFATGIGIAAQIPYIKELIHGFNQCTVRTKSICLIWEIDDDTEQDWVLDWMDELLATDSGSYILRIFIYDPSDRQPPPTGLSEHNRIEKFSERMNLESILLHELGNCKGKLLVTVSANNAVRDAIRGLLRVHLDPRVELFDLEFQPKGRRSEENRGSSSAIEELEMNYRGV